ncbi:hypothetical protein [Thalassospira sp. A3_1]|uniref:hypothetical protein n=1 Tax=Thalassospira sp. A3_1 TaxID=2821088 RepID=UPI001ADB0589|nr:hypothetical protein [Thalassospira sp. A3_1]MBO9509648.1 hypothetical protein [Thalassospira sp. A3_1]
MTEEAIPARQKLEGEAALKLWRQGRDAWNSWIDQHPGWDISFAGVDFSSKRDPKGNLSFSGYHFGDGLVDFSSAIFGDGLVDFSLAKFGEGHLDFSFATFGNGNVSFIWATFGNGNVDFAYTTFGNGNVDFAYITFGNGFLHFYRASFLNSDVHFPGTTFGSGEISFRQVKINNLNFNPESVELRHIQAKELSIKGRAIFALPSSASSLKSFNLHSASFDGPLTLQGNLTIIPDLRATRSSHQVELSDLNVKLPRISPKLGWPPKLSRMAEDPQDGARLRRLKEIAETNKDHQAALRFSADENRAKRWIETSWFGSVLDMAFSAFSDYGQNILRPFAALIVLTAASMGLYKTLATETSAAGWAGWAQAALLSASNSLPFLPQSRDLREDALTALYGTDPGSWVNALMITQGALSFIFLFLIGLGLRNRFRL